MTELMALGELIKVVGAPVAGMLLLGYLLRLVMVRVNGKLDRMATALERDVEAHADTVAALGKLERAIKILANRPAEDSDPE